MSTGTTKSKVNSGPQEGEPTPTDEATAAKFGSNRELRMSQRALTANLAFWVLACQIQFGDEEANGEMRMA